MDREYERIVARLDAALDLVAHRLRAGSERGEAHVYPRTKHWFVEGDHAEYDAEAAELVYSRTVESLRRHLA